MGQRGPVGSRFSRRNSGRPVGLQVDSGLPKMPAGLPADVRKIWKELVRLLDGIEILSNLDAAALEDFCVCLVRLRQCELDISTRGLLVEGDGGRMVKNPAATLAKSYRDAVQKWVGQFCMSPVARARLGVKPDDRDPNSPWAKFRKEPSLEEILSLPRNDSKPTHGAN